jgi:hypothetical protein
LIAYYESVKAKMGAAATDKFARLFMLPGVQHCDGGPGPTGWAGASALRKDAQHDVEAALERWVEDGVAPTQIIAARYKTGPTLQAALCALGHCVRIRRSRATRDREHGRRRELHLRRGDPLVLRLATSLPRAP